MLQIKTIKHPDPERFDDKVNEALADGWNLTRRLAGPDAFVAELEKNVITEDEKTCENCRHYMQAANIEPCASCDPENGTCYWEAME